MIDWTHLLFTALWTLGLAALLATFSLAHWLIGRSDRSLHQTLMEPRFHLILAAVFVLVALGATFSVEPWWHKVVWAGVLVLSAWEGMAAWRDWRLAERSSAE
jgi:hypothetical protein